MSDRSVLGYHVYYCSYENLDSVCLFSINTVCVFIFNKHSFKKDYKISDGCDAMPHRWHRMKYTGYYLSTVFTVFVFFAYCMQYSYVPCLTAA